MPTMPCLRRLIENAPEAGDYRVFNQFEEVYDVMELAERVQRIGHEFDLDVKIHPLENPRTELEDHYYEPDHQHLLDLVKASKISVETALAAASNPADFKTKLAMEGADPEAVVDEERSLGPMELESDERF